MDNNNTTISFSGLYIQINLGEPAPETVQCTIYIQLSASLSLLMSLQFSLINLLHLQWSIASLGFMHKSFISLITTSFHVFLGPPLSLAPPTSKVAHFFHPIIIIFTIAIYYFIPLLLCHLFLTTALIQFCKIVYPLISSNGDPYLQYPAPVPSPDKLEGLH